MEALLPLAGLRCVECATGVAAAYAGRLLASMGADVTMIEPRDGSPLRREPPFLGPRSGESALFAYLSAGKQAISVDLDTEAGREEFARLIGQAQVLVEDVPVAQRELVGIAAEAVSARWPDLVHLSILPFGSCGPKSRWVGSELNLIHSAGEGFLLPNGLSAALFPDRPPLKIAGHFAEMQGGIAGALDALAALWSGIGQYVDVSIQDANLAVGAFTVQRYGDGSLEHRLSRSFRYGGVIACMDGYVELLTLEQRQWQGLIELMGHPEWARDPALEDATERSTRGDFINAQIREWAGSQLVEDVVVEAQKLGVPMARYNAPEQILDGHHEAARGLFSTMSMPEGGECKMQTGPFRFDGRPLPARPWPTLAPADRDVEPRQLDSTRIRVGRERA
ncbi:L-carnitine dehydratase/bile acid-inducible protein F [Rhizobium sp. CF080]|uniref:CoA transferase n=1 Tax=Rhizobium sp. (strain CF080) TaxID=1144310 RepID=UPI000271A2CF|nr:CoA transferase [Rhizobium sp. CF080]EUB99704.1 L-carnitine dehydratase/bile acid-inducible protein F [Rhizobium sp. CF080]